MSQLGSYGGGNHFGECEVVVLDRYLQGKMGGSVDTDLYKQRVDSLAAAAVERMESL